MFAWMLMIGLIVFGLISFWGMGISRLPDVDFPTLNVSVTWAGAAPETMETAVTDVIENAVMSVAGIRNVTSTSQEGLSNTTIEFELGVDVDTALQEVQTKISQAQRTLPDTIDPPVVTKTNPEDQPILWAALTGTSSQREKILFARDRLQNSLTTVSGVGDVRLGGYVDPNMRIWLDNDKMRNLQVTVDDVISAIRAGTLLTPAGYLEKGAKETSVRVLSEPRTAKEFEELIIPRRGGQPIWTPIYVGDVGRAEEGLAEVRRISRLGGVPSVGLGVVKQRGSNAVAVGDAVKQKLKDLGGLLPQGMKLSLVVDTTKFIRESTNELLFTLMLSAVLTSVICYLFLGSIGSAVNVILAIPTSLIGAFILLRAFGFTINTFTLLALSLSIGIVVDDAIMVLENIVRYFENGMSRVRASLIGAREITGAALASTLAILAIFLPVVFMKGVAGRFFLQFGVTMSVAVLLSLVEALTLAPMRCSEFLTHGSENRLNRSVDRVMNALSRFYRAVLERALGLRWLVVGGAVALFAGSLFLFRGIPAEFVPAQDQSLFLASINTPIGSSLQFTDNVFKKAEALLKQRPEVDTYLSAVGGFQGGLVNQGIMFIVLKDPGERGVAPPFRKPPTQQEFMGWARKAINGISGVERAAMIDLSQQGFASGRGFPISFTVQGPDWKKLGELAHQMMDRMRRSGLMTDIDTDYNPDMPELRIAPDVVKAGRYGVTVDNIANTISAMVGSLAVAKYTDPAGHRDDVRVKVEEESGQTAGDINRIQVRNIHGEIIPLSSVVKMERTGALLTVSRYDRERAITINANPAPGQAQAEALAFVERAAKSLLPAGYHIEMAGSSQAFRESFQSLWFALGLGIFVAYMVLAAQFNSFIHPVTILLALPFSFTGAFLAMRLTGQTLNIYSMIGMLLLMGIVKKNSILLVDFTNRHRDVGGPNEKGVHEALLEACPLRLRPILMTSIATVAAAIPPAVAIGPGAETTRPMAIVVIGGVTFSTLLTLLVVPCAYSLFTRLEGHHHQRELAEAAEIERREERKRLLDLAHDQP